MSATTPKLLHILAALLCVFSASTSATIQCWKNSEGVRECGNSIPPEYSQKEVVELNQSGVTIGVRERAPTADELKSVRDAKAQHEREARAAAKVAAKQQAYDNVLKNTFLNEGDILHSRDQKVIAIDATITMAHNAIRALDVLLARKQKKAARSERLGHAVPAEIIDEIDSINRQLDERYAYIDRQKVVIGKIKAEYEKLLIRFIELKSAKR